MIRFAFINTADKALELRFKTDDDIQWDMLPTTADGAFQENVAKFTAGAWVATLEPGIVYGFRTPKEPTFAAGDSITVLRADGKDPWPKPPPPPPPPYAKIPDFEKHLNRFFKPAE